MELGPLAQEALTRSLPVALLSVALYCLPAITAWYRSHRNTAAITALTLLLGWTGIGWIGALIWALMRPPERP